MLFDPDKLDDNDPRKITFLKQQEDQRQRAQKQPADQENSDKVRPNPNAIATITPMKSAVVASNGNGDEDPNAIATITPTKSAVVASNGNGDEEEEKVHPLNNPVFNEYVEQQQKADQEVSPKESTTVSNSLKRVAVTSSHFLNNDERNNKRLKQNVTDSTYKDSPVPEEPPKVDIVKDGTNNGTDTANLKVPSLIPVAKPLVKVNEIIASSNEWQRGHIRVDLVIPAAEPFLTNVTNMDTSYANFH